MKTLKEVTARLANIHKEEKNKQLAIIPNVYLMSHPGNF